MGEESWLSIDIHLLMVQIIKKWNDKQWMSKSNGQHAICIYYAMSILRDLCKGKNKIIINKIATDTSPVETLLEILSTGNDNVSFVESSTALLLLTELMLSDNLKKIFGKIG